MKEIRRPGVRPRNPRFSSGPCAKPPGWQLHGLQGAFLGRSHRAAEGKAKLLQVIDLTREILRVPDDFRVGIVPASDTGAMEMAMWSLLGARPVELLAWESFGKGWAKDVVSQLKLSPKLHEAAYGALPDLSEINFDNDVVFTWNGTTSGVRVPNGDFIPSGRDGVVICDATSAAFAVPLPWDKLDATTFSWQKVLGGEATHGMLILSPRAIARLETHAPPWPLPKIFRLVKAGRLNESLFRGETINTPSMLCVEDCLQALAWVKSIGGLDILVARADANANVLARFVERRDWIGFLAERPETRSNTSVCLKFTDGCVSEGDAGPFARSVAARLDRENVAHDIGSYRDAPPGLRIWCGATVNAGDLEKLTPWIEWSYRVELAVRGIGES